MENESQPECCTVCPDFFMFLQRCATPRSAFGEEQVFLGWIERIERASIDSEAGFGYGAILRRVVGGIFGNKIVGVRCSDAATVLGVLGGGYAGAKAEHKLSAPSAGRKSQFDWTIGYKSR